MGAEITQLREALKGNKKRKKTREKKMRSGKHKKIRIFINIKERLVKMNMWRKGRQQRIQKEFDY